MNRENLRTPLTAACLFLCVSLAAQLPKDTLIHLTDAVQMAAQGYHTLKAGKFESDAAIRQVAVAKYGRRPTIDATYQASIATANNLTGMFYPTGVLPMSGPPSLQNNYTMATGSAAALLLNWQAVTFGERAAQIRVSEAAASVAEAQYKQDVFAHKIKVISTYLDLLLAYEVVHIQERNIERVQANLKQSRILAIAGIRPGVDSALFLSELSKAKIALLHAQTELQNDQWILRQMMVTSALPVPADTGLMSSIPSLPSFADTAMALHPVVLYAKRQFELSESKESLLKKSYLPKLNAWATTFGRGTGFQADGTIRTAEGLGLSRYNYGAGVQLLFPIMKYGEAKRQLEQQKDLSAAARERLRESEEDLQMQLHIASTTFNNSLAVSAQTQQQLTSGRYAFHAMQIRYHTGLVNFSELIQVQYNLLAAELEVKKGYWDVWKALLLQAAVQGDEQFFLNAIK